MFFLLVFFLSLLLPADTFAEQPPEWIFKTPEKDKNNRYFIGEGYGKTNDEALRHAKKDALDQALTFLGVTVYSETVISQKNDEDDIDGRSEITSGAVIKEFKRKNTFCSEKEREFGCYVLYAYPLKELEKEKKRLKGTNSGETASEMHMIGNNPQDGILSVYTGNIVADLYVDGVKMGKTPCTLNGVLPREGSYKIKIDSEAHEVYETKIDFYKNKENTVTAVLKPAYAYVKFETDPDPDGAVIKMNGREIKSGERQTVQAGTTVRIEASHPQYKTFTSEYVFKRKEKKTVKIPLLEEEANLYLIVSSPDYKVEIDGDVSDSKDRERHFRLPPGDHKITVYMKKSKIASDTFTLKPAEKRTMEINEEFLESRRKEQKKGTPLPAVFVPYKSTGSFSGKFNTSKLSNMLNDIDFSYLVPRLSYDTRSGSVRFTVTVGIDPKKYREAFVEPLKKSISAASYSSSKTQKTNLTLRCMTVEGQPHQFCGVKPLSVPMTAYIRTDEPVTSLFSQKAQFLSVADIPDWAAGYDDIPVKKLEVFFALFDRNKNNLAAYSFPFTLIPFQVVGNMYVFSPVMTDDRTICRESDLFGGSAEFVCGTTVFQAKTGKVRIDLNNASDIYISIGAAK